MLTSFPRFRALLAAPPGRPPSCAPAPARLAARLAPCRARSPKMEGDDAAAPWLPDDFLASPLHGPADFGFADVLLEDLARWPSVDMVRALGR